MSDAKISEAAVEAASASMEATKNSLEMTPLDRIRLMLTAAFPHLHPQPAELIEQQAGEVQGDAAEHIRALEAATRWSATSRPFKAALLAGVAAIAARQPGAREPFGWWLQDDNSVGYFSRTMQPAALYAHRNAPGYSATPLYTAPRAQGIDLEKARDEGHDGAIRYVLGYLNGVGDWGSTQYVELLNACGRERIIQSAVQDDELDFTGLARWVAERGTDKDRALIGQRDAAPGVGQ